MNLHLPEFNGQLHCVESGFENGLNMLHDSTAYRVTVRSALVRILLETKIP